MNHYNEARKKINHNGPSVDKRRTPFGEKKFHAKKMGFIVEPTTNPKLQQLLEYDIYRNNTEESKIAQQYVNMAGLPFETSETASSILYGVPSNAISGIVVGNELAKNKEKIEIIKKYFPNSYITTQYGVLIYNPNWSEITINDIKQESLLDNTKGLKLSSLF